MASFTKPSAYSSAYSKQIASALGNITDRQQFSYDPLQDANYQALAKVYNANGQRAMQDTMGQAAALNGGYGSSYAVSAAGQAQNDYNQQLAALIPDLEQNAYQRYYDNFNMNVSALGALNDADQSAYAKYRDKVADYQWQKEYNLSKKRASRSGGGGSGGGGYSGSYGGSTVDQSMYNKAQKLAGTKNDPSGLTGKAAQATLAKMAAKAKSKTKSSSSKKYKTTGMSSK